MPGDDNLLRRKVAGCETDGQIKRRSSTEADCGREVHGEKGSRT